MTMLEKYINMKDNVLAGISSRVRISILDAVG